MSLVHSLQRCLSVVVLCLQAFWRLLLTSAHETTGPARTSPEMTLTHAEPRLKPLGDPLQGSAAETATHKRSRSYPGYTPYHLQVPHADLGNRAHGERSISPCDTVAASASAGTESPPQLWPDTESDTEESGWTQSNRGSLTTVTPPVWNILLPRAFTMNGVHSSLPPLGNTGYISHYLQLPPVSFSPLQWPYTKNDGEDRGCVTAVVQARPDCVRGASVQPHGGVSHVSASELTWQSRQLVSAGSTRHHRGQCKPCAFVHKGNCADGMLCNFCHLCKPGEKRRRQRENIKKAKKVWHLKHDFLRSSQLPNQ